MSILLIICLVIAVIAITAYLISNAKLEPEPEETKKDGYPAVTINFAESDACPAVMKMAGQRFLCADAPALPLVDCTQEVCSCTFRHYDDMRTGPRRADEKGFVTGRYESIERRAGQPGRRPEETFTDTVEQEKEQFSGTHEDTYHGFIEQTGSMTAPTEKQTAKRTAGLFGSAPGLLRRMRRKAT